MLKACAKTKRRIEAENSFQHFREKEDQEGKKKWERKMQMRNKNLTAFLFLELSYDRDVKNSWNEKKCQRKRPTLVESRDDALRSKDRHMKTSTEWPYVGLKVERSTLKHVDRMVLPT